jgi:hypothetical protein
LEMVKWLNLVIKCAERIQFVFFVSQMSGVEKTNRKQLFLMGTWTFFPI